MYCILVLTENSHSGRGIHIFFCGGKAAAVGVQTFLYFPIFFRLCFLSFCSLRVLAMAEELQDLRDQVAVLMAENEKLRLDQVQPTASTSARTTTAPVIERLVYIPRDRKCPMFRGHTGISLGEWVEEVEACMRARHLSQPADRAFFLFDHLEGEARNEIKYRASADRENPDKIFSMW